MRIRVVSDLHIEFMGKIEWDDVIDDFSGDDADVLVLAGDILPLKYVDEVRKYLGAFCERYGDVIYVPGNHEYYGTDVRSAHVVLGAVENEISNLRVLKNSWLHLNGKSFFGGTMWFPELPKGLEHLKEMMNDFFQIQGIEPFCYSQHRDFRRMAASILNDKIVVISHHLPSWESVDVKYTASPLNRFFVGDCEDLIKSFQPKLWIHGHTHDSCDYVGQRFPLREGDTPTLGNTRVICNPYGYNGFNQNYKKVLIDL